MFQRELFAVIALVALGLAMTTRVEAQTTQTGTITNGSIVYYSFTPPASGQLVATLSWDNQSSVLLFVLVCGTSDPMIYGVASGLLDRTARLESGIVGLNPCIIAVSGTPGATAAYRLNVQRSTDQLATVQTATLRDVEPRTARSVDAGLVEEAERALSVVRARLH